MINSGKNTSQGQRPKERQEVFGKIAYNSRRNLGLSWLQIGAGIGSSADTTTKLAKRYAKDNGLPWPVPRPRNPPVPLRSARRLSRGRFYYMLMQKTGATVTETAHQRGVNPSALHSDVKNWVKATGTRWPLLKRNRKAQAAYELRAQGLPWKHVAKQAQYKHRQSAIGGARKYARDNNLKWPPQE